MDWLNACYRTAETLVDTFSVVSIQAQIRVDNKVKLISWCLQSCATTVPEMHQTMEEISKDAPVEQFDHTQHGGNTFSYSWARRRIEKRKVWCRGPKSSIDHHCIWIYDYLRGWMAARAGCLPKLCLYGDDNSSSPKWLPTGEGRFSRALSHICRKRRASHAMSKICPISKFRLSH